MADTGIPPLYDEERAAGHDAAICRAVSQHGAPVTAYGIPGRGAVLVIARRDGEFICTQDPGHAGSHAACDGRGHILVRWPKKAAERYWQPGDCAGHDHERSRT